MNKNLNVIMVATLMIAYSAFVGAQEQQGGGHHGPQMDASTKAAFEACITENNLVKPERGQRPSDEDRQKLDACLKAKGISMPKPPSGQQGHNFPPPEQQDDQDQSS